MKRPYSAYKESGISWVGEIPDHWQVLKGKWLFRKMQRSVRDEDDVVTVFRDGMVTLRSNRRTEGFTNSLKEIGYQGIRKGDLVIHQMDAFAGAIGVSDSDGKSTPVYSVCLPVDDADPHYYAYLLRRMAQSQWILALAKGIRERSSDFRFNEFANQEYPVPPAEEQAAIVAFLEEQTAVINQFLTNKRRLIALLEEQKQVVINTAVTQGLDTAVPRKPSGVDWLGDIPTHWTEKRAKYFFYEVNERSETGEEELLSVSHITGVTPRSEKNISMFQAESYEGYKTCQPDDFVINIMWAWMGAMGVSQHHGIISSAYGVYRQLKSNTFFSPYLDHLVRVNQYIAEYTCRSTGIRSSRLRMYTDDFFDMPIICPPYDEQVAIVQHIEQKTAEINAAIERTQHEIELIEEYRTTLIAHVVTGKIDVTTGGGARHGP